MNSPAVAVVRRRVASCRSGAGPGRQQGAGRCAHARQVLALSGAAFPGTRLLGAELHYGCCCAVAAASAVAALRQDVAPTPLP